MNKQFPFKIEERNLNMIINSKCHQSSKCSNNSTKNDEYFQEDKSTSLIQSNEIHQIVINNFGDAIQNFSQAKINYFAQQSTDKFQIHSNSKEVSLPFLSLTNVESDMKVKLFQREIIQNIFCKLKSGVISLQRNNAMNIFKIGYQQKVYQNPCFQIRLNNDYSVSLLYNQPLEAINKLPSLPTSSSSSWDLKITGIYIESEDVQKQSHFHSVVFTFSQGVTLPQGLFNYIRNKYSNHFTHYRHSLLKECTFCSCLQNKSLFPDIEIYTPEYHFTIEQKYYFYPFIYGCSMMESNNRMEIGAEFLSNNHIIFNPQSGSLILPNIDSLFQRAQLVKHMNCDESLRILLSCSLTILIIIIIFLIGFELNQKKLRNEGENYKLITSEMKKKQVKCRSIQTLELINSTERSQSDKLKESERQINCIQN